MSTDARFAIIHVKPDANSDAWPVVERVPGGWQSGAYHYPDQDVLNVKPLYLATAAIDLPARFKRAAEVAKRKGDTWGYYALRNIAHWLESAAPRDVVEAIGRALLGREV